MDKKHRWLVHPRSFFELVIAGFSLVALPLIIALVTGAFFINKLTDQSQEAVYRAVQSTQASRQIIEQIGAMERYIRQYFVLGDQTLFEAYFDRHQAYKEIELQLQTLLHDANLKNRLDTLSQLEDSLFQKLKGATTLEEARQVDAVEFINLTKIAQALLKDSSQVIDSEMSIMRDISEQASRIIFWELLAVIPGAVIFIVVFVVLLSRPIRQIDMAIKQLGAGDFGQEIKVSGPRDLEYLGERLDWLRARLKYLEEKKNKFLHYVSHELKTPLTAIREGAELLSEGVTGPLSEGQRDVTDILKKNSINLQKMIEKLLSFNMPGQAQLSSGMSAVLLQHVVETVLADHKPVIMAKHIDVKVKCEHIVLTGDEEQLRVIVDNLISNALKYTPKEGRITVQLRTNDNNEVLFEVTDSGPGIDPAEKDLIFEAFYRGSAGGKGLIKGSGLGLSIVKEFVQAHKGQIEVMDVPGEKGAHFRVSLPVRQPEKELAWAI